MTALADIGTYKKTVIIDKTGIISYHIFFFWGSTSSMSWVSWYVVIKCMAFRTFCLSAPWEVQKSSESNSILQWRQWINYILKYIVFTILGISNILVWILGILLGCVGSSILTDQEAKRPKRLLRIRYFFARYK